MCLHVQLQTCSLDTVTRVHCCGDLITSLPQIGHSLVCCGIHSFCLYRVSTRNVGAGTQRVFANKRAVENFASIYIFEVGEICDMSISSSIFFFTLRCVTNFCLLAVGRVEQRWRIRYSNCITGRRTEDSSFAFRQVQEDSSTQRPDRLWGPLHVQCVLGALSLRVKREGR
jgi:hypothetical protein